MREHIGQIEMLRTIWSSSGQRASLPRRQLRRRTFGCPSLGRAARLPRSHKRQPGRQVNFFVLQFDFSGVTTVCLILDRWRHVFSVLKFVMLQSPRTGRPSGDRRSAGIDGRTMDAHMKCAQSNLASSTSGGTLAASSHLTFPTTRVDSACSRLLVSTSPATWWSSSSLRFPLLRRWLLWGVH